MTDAAADEDDLVTRSRDGDATADAHDGLVDARRGADPGVPLGGELRRERRAGADAFVADGPAEAGIVADLRAGGPRSFEAFYEAFAASIYRTALSLVHDPMTAEEIVADTFLRAYEARDHLDATRSPLPWLQRVAVNLALSSLRHRRIVASSLERLARLRLPAQTSEWPAPAEGPDLAISLRRGLERLPADLRVPVVLRYVLDASVDEVAAVTGLAPRTVRYRLRVALRRLRADLADEDVSLPRGRAAVAPLAPAPAVNGTRPRATVVEVAAGARAAR